MEHVPGLVIPDEALAGANIHRMFAGARLAP